MSTEPQSNGDGILSDLGSSDFGSMIGNDATTPSSPGAPEGAPATQQPAGTPPAGAPQEGAPPATGTPPVVSPAAATPPPQPSISDIIKSTVESTASAFRQQQTPPPAPAPTEMSSQDFDAKYGIIRPNEQMVNQLFNTDPRQAVAVLDHLFQANLTASLRMANDIIEAKLNQLQEQYRPITQSFQEQQKAQQNAASENRFFTAFPNLANEKGLVMEMKDAFIAKVQAGQIKFNTEAEAFAAVANATQTILNRIRPGGSPINPTQPGVVSRSNGRQMVTASGTGRQGSGTPSANQPKNIVDEVFGSDAR